MKPVLLVSACLMGRLVKYNGKLVPVHDRLKALAEEGLVLSFCPEVVGGLSVPRPPAEITGGDGRTVLEGRARVIRKDGRDVTENFITGAEQAWAEAKRWGLTVALLQDGSPACGSTRIYDGTFSGTSIPGFGVAAALLKSKGLRILTENHIETLTEFRDYP